jgi:hypothetical protein
MRYEHAVVENSINSSRSNILSFSGKFAPYPSKLKTNKEVTFEEITDYLKNQSELLEYDPVISQRPFQRDLTEIRSLHNMDIQFDHSRKVYFIEEEENSNLNNRMMEAFDFISAVKMSEDLGKFIHFEKRKPLGTHHFYGLLHAVRNQLIIDLFHQKFEFDEPTRRFVEPYGFQLYIILEYSVEEKYWDQLSRTTLTDCEK